MVPRYWQMAVATEHREPPARTTSNPCYYSGPGKSCSSSSSAVTFGVWWLTNARPKHWYVCESCGRWRLDQGLCESYACQHSSKKGLLGEQKTMEQRAPQRREATGKVKNGEGALATGATVAITIETAATVAHLGETGKRHCRLTGDHEPSPHCRMCNLFDADNQDNRHRHSSLVCTWMAALLTVYMHGRSPCFVSCLRVISGLVGCTFLQQSS